MSEFQIFKNIKNNKDKKKNYQYILKQLKNIKNIKDNKTYVGILSVWWKLGYNNHIYSFSHEHLQNQTSLGKHFWKLKKKRLTPEIQWRILKRSTTPSCFDGRCNLCLEEKIQIMFTVILVTN